MGCVPASAPGQMPVFRMTRSVSQAQHLCFEGSPCFRPVDLNAERHVRDPDRSERVQVVWTPARR
jgi:hypothetical protein